MPVKVLKSLLIQCLLRFGTQNRPNIWISRKDEATNLKMNEQYYLSESESRKKTINFLSNLRAKNVFEFGCNSGPNARLLLNQEINGYTGLDINESALKFARKNINRANFEFINWNELSKKDDSFYDQFDTFFSIYSMAYVNSQTAKNILKKFKKCNYFIFCEPQNRLRFSLALNRTPEYSHDYHRLIELLGADAFNAFQMDLETPTYNAKRILVFIRQQI